MKTKDVIRQVIDLLTLNYIFHLSLMTIYQKDLFVGLTDTVFL